MPRPPSPHPTALELQILQALWRHESPAPARHVVDALAAENPHKKPAYTSIVTVMNIMTRKGYLKRLKADPGYVYKPLITEKRTLTKMLRDLVDRAFRGSPAAAALTLLETADLDPAELRRIRAALARHDDRKRKDPPP